MLARVARGGLTRPMPGGRVVGVKGRPSATTVIACLALFFSLGGAGVAARGYLAGSSPELRTVRGTAVVLAPGTTATAQVACAGGRRALTGGYRASPVIGPPAPRPYIPGLFVDATEPSGASGWRVVASNGSNRFVAVMAWVLCARRR